MLIIPAIDIRDGKCVRLFKGEFHRETIYSDDPVGMAKRWVQEGAERIHVVDLDGARDGVPRNAGIIHEIIHAASCRVEVGGGIRTPEDALAYLESGADRIILGSAIAAGIDRMVPVFERFPDRIAIGLDVKDGMIAIAGWTKTTALTLEAAISQVTALRPCAIVYTEILLDGTLAGPPIEGLTRLVSLTRIPIIASGGVRNIEDIRKLLHLASQGVEGVIVGKSIYAGTLDLRQAIAAAREGV